MDKINIGYDAKRIVKNGTGLGSYGRTLINDFIRRDDKSTQFFLYAPDKGNDDLRKQIIKSDNARFVYPQDVNTQISKSYWRTKSIVKDLLRDKINIFHGLSGELPIGLKRNGIHGIVTIHDLIFMRHPEYYNWIDTKIYTWKFKKALQEADRIIAISECTKRDIIELGNVDPDKIDLIYQSYNPRFTATCSDDEKQRVSNAYKLPQRYILTVGSIERRKNALLAVKALEALPEDISFVIVGKRTPYTAEIERYAAKHNLLKRIQILHGVPDNDLSAIYNMAEVFVYPSRYEGFGIPIIEAIGCGLPVVACTGSCLEEAGGSDCIYVAPDDVRGMAEAIKQLLKGNAGREQRIKNSMAYIQRFAGLDVAEQVTEVYKKVLQ